MKIALFYHSLVSDWNHGNAHFLRGISKELLKLGHDLRVFEPRNGWSRKSLVEEQGEAALIRFRQAFPMLSSELYSAEHFDAGAALDGVDLAIVHEWNDPEVIGAIGAYRLRNPEIRVLFHDTHHRAVSAPDELARFDLTAYDGVLAYGASLRDAYVRLGWGKQVHVWHEAADTDLFFPRRDIQKTGDVVWIGNWGDEERTEELRTFLLEPVSKERLATTIYGVRYPRKALDELAQKCIQYRGWLPNFEAPSTFAEYRATVHVPRRPYVRQLPGIPTIRVFEALACGIPLVSAPWNDTENLFRPGIDYLQASTEEEMRSKLRSIVRDEAVAEELTRNGLETIRQRHTCAHRLRELLSIYEDLKPNRLGPEREARAEVLQ